MRSYRNIFFSFLLAASLPQGSARAMNFSSLAPYKDYIAAALGIGLAAGITYTMLQEREAEQAENRRWENLQDLIFDAVGDTGKALGRKRHKIPQLPFTKKLSMGLYLMWSNSQQPSLLNLKVHLSRNQESFNHSQSASPATTSSAKIRDADQTYTFMIGHAHSVMQHSEGSFIPLPKRVRFLDSQRSQRTIT